MKLKLMTDYGAGSPVWDDEAGGGPLDLTTLAISDDLRSALARWQAAYDATYCRSDPAASGFGSPAAERAFEADGKQLQQRLVSELPACEVRYFSG